MWGTRLEGGEDGWLVGRCGFGWEDLGDGSEDAVGFVEDDIFDERFSGWLRVGNPALGRSWHACPGFLARQLQHDYADL
jgi:hypothetical protein